MSEELNTENYLAKWLQGDLSDSELNKLRESGDIQDYENIVKEIDTWKVRDLNLDQSYDELKSKVASHKSEAKVISLKSRRTMWLSIAATITILIASYVVFINMNSSVDTFTYATAAGEQKDIELPDGTEIVLGGKTTLSFDKNAYDGDRTVELKGSAYFKVIKGDDFKVKLDQGTVQVLGTKYDIRSSDQYFSVQCYEGKVSVKSNNDNLDVLTKGMGLHYIKGQKFESFNVDGDAPDWINQKSSFKNTPLIEVVDALEGQYGLEIDFGDIDTDRRYTGSFVNHDMQLALKLVFEPLNIEFKLEGKKVLLK